MRAEYKKQIEMTYNDQAKYLQEKYGRLTGNYFLTESCKSTNSSVKRISEGLYIHHIAEYHPNYPTVSALSSTNEALKVPFIFQTPEWLCYCNYIEHIILHIKIFDLRGDESAHSGLCELMFPELKYWYITKGEYLKGKWNEPAYILVKDDEGDFIELYNVFYKSHTKAKKYSYQEYMQNQRRIG